MDIKETSGIQILDISIPEVYVEPTKK